jgi:hypothetical protein
MKWLRFSFVLIACFTLCGCFTINTVDVAKGSPLDNGKGEKVPREEPKPALYCLLPLTVVADIATSPFQALFMLWAYGTHWNG